MKGPRAGLGSLTAHALHLFLQHETGNWTLACFRRHVVLLRIWSWANFCLL